MSYNNIINSLCRAGVAFRWRENKRPNQCVLYKCPRTKGPMLSTAVIWPIPGYQESYVRLKVGPRRSRFERLLR